MAKSVIEKLIKITYNPDEEKLENGVIPSEPFLWFYSTITFTIAFCGQIKR